MLFDPKTDANLFFEGIDTEPVEQDFETPMAETLDIPFIPSDQQ